LKCRIAVTQEKRGDRKEYRKESSGGKNDEKWQNWRIRVPITINLKGERWNDDDLNEIHPNFLLDGLTTESN